MKSWKQILEVKFSTYKIHEKEKFENSFLVIEMIVVQLFYDNFLNISLSYSYYVFTLSIVLIFVSILTLFFIFLVVL